MCFKVSFISHYNTLWRYYFLLFFLLFFLLWHMRLLFSCFFSYYDRLSIIIFPIIFKYDRVSAPWQWDWADRNCWPEELGMGDKCPCTRPANVDQLEAAYSEWISAWCCVPELLYALFFLLHTLIFLADQNCCCCEYVLRTADLCKTILCVEPS